MRLRPAATAAVLALVPLAAEASDICQALQRRLMTLPQVIGNTAEVRQHAEALRQNNDEIRYLRSEMRRTRCGGGSIVTYGQRNDVCGEMAAALGEMERQREAILAQRSQVRQMVRPSSERNAILAAMDANQCRSDEAAPIPIAIEPATAAPAEGAARSRSSITTLSPRAETVAPLSLQPEAPPAPPERPYDPSRKVRSVGPVFLPDESSIDLTSPGSGGAQPNQWP
jgi:hypothetical protein